MLAGRVAGTGSGVGAVTVSVATTGEGAGVGAGVGAGAGAGVGAGAGAGAAGLQNFRKNVGRKSKISFNIECHHSFSHRFQEISERKILVP